MICMECFGKDLQCEECRGQGQVYCCDTAGAGIAEGGTTEWSNWADGKFPPRFLELAALLLGAKNSAAEA